jgi:bifunctional DNase/RNase/predicted DNA-binding protein YlxM (UPF0122 family)
LDATFALLVNDAPEPQAMVEMREYHEMVLAAIGTLSPQNREAVLLYYYDQLSLREISVTLGISTTAVKGRLHKSRRQLATYFSQLAEQEPWFAEDVTELTSSHLPASAVPAHGREVHEKRKKKMIEVKVIDVIFPQEDKQGPYMLVLLDEAGQRVLPIWVGPAEANYIALQLLKNVPQRPMSYDFMASVLAISGTTLDEVQINTIQDYTFYATAFMRVGDSVHPIDARPSDAVALALRLKCNIFVADEVMEKTSRAIPEKFQHKFPRKGLEQLAAQMEEAHQSRMAMLDKMRDMEKTRSEAVSDATQRFFAEIFGE